MLPHPPSISLGIAMQVGLRRDVYYCVANQQIALLDLRADRYYCLPAPVEAALKRVIEAGGDSSGETDALAPLLKRQLLETGIPWTSRTPSIDPPRISAMDSHHEPTDLILVGRAALSNLQAMQTLKRKSLLTIIETRRACKTTARPDAMQRALPELVASFLVVRRLLGAHDKCLRWSLAMTDYLAALGHFPNLVLGVRLRPFAAHAWVQAGDVVLSDRLDHVLLYTPILVV